MELTSQLSCAACSLRISTGPLNMDNTFLHTFGKGEHIIQVSWNKLVWNIIDQSLEYCCGISQTERHDYVLKIAKRELKSCPPFISFPHSLKIIGIGKKQWLPVVAQKQGWIVAKNIIYFCCCSNLSHKSVLSFFFTKKRPAPRRLEDGRMIPTARDSLMYFCFQCLLFWTRQIVETAPGSCSVVWSKWQYGGKQAARSLLTTLSASW